MSEDYAGARARDYDRGMDVLFRTFGADEAVVREGMVALLNLSAGARVLETGCGTFLDTGQLATRAASIVATDLSSDMIHLGRERLARSGARDRIRLCVSDATALPFAGASFDAAFHFGGINLFSDVARGIAEMTRVVKPGGKVVFGDEGVAPWLAEREFGKILVNSNPLYRHQPPLACLPSTARNVACRWILNGAFYLVDFVVGESEPFLDLDVQFPGWRGGSHRTRYFGKLEGVDPAIRQQVIDAAAREGIPVAAWLENTLRHVLDK